MWSMMNNLETSLRVPLILRAPSLPRGASYAGLVELIDLYPTVAGLAGLRPPADLPGTDLAPSLRGGATGAAAKPYALGQITRCTNCTLAYLHAAGDYARSCRFDRAADRGLPVPCCTTPRSQFDAMGLSMRTAEWRYTTWCGWDGAQLRPKWHNCSAPELFDHRNDTSPYDVDGPFEHVNLAGQPALRDVEQRLRAQLMRAFDGRG